MRVRRRAQPAPGAARTRTRTWVALLALAASLVGAVPSTAPGAHAATGTPPTPILPTPILPPANPSASIGVGRYNPPGCGGVRDVSAVCLRESLAMVNAGRRSEGLGPLVLPANWTALTVAQQLYLLVELERSARGLPVDAGLSAGLNQAAVAGADAGRDPTGTTPGFAGLWAGGEPNAIVVVADWLYEDGLFADGFTENLSCSPANPTSCWQHRDIVLHHGGAGSCGLRCAVGAGYSPGGYRQATDTGRDSYATVFARAGAGPETFTWAAELPQLPACEQSGDTCDWTGSPVAAPSGIVTVGAPRAASRPDVSPWFAVSVTSRLSGRGRFTLMVQVGVRLLGLTVVAHLGARQVPFTVRSLSDRRFAADGRLAAGTWTVRVRYRVAGAGRRRPMSDLQVTVP